MGCNPVQFILWLLVLIFLSFIVAFFCAPLYVIVHCLSGFIKPLSDDSGELIFYERPDTLEPKLSEYKKLRFNAQECRGLASILADTNGVLGIVEKTRYLYTIGQSRVHIDDVSNLGTFAEIEVVLKNDQSVDVGRKISEDLMEKLGIKSCDLISKAYVDLLSPQSE